LKVFEISIDIDGFLAPILINLKVGNKILNWSSQHKNILLVSTKSGGENFIKVSLKFYYENKYYW